MAKRVSANGEGRTFRQHVGEEEEGEEEGNINGKDLDMRRVDTTSGIKSEQFLFK